MSKSWINDPREEIPNGVLEPRQPRVNLFSAFWHEAEIRAVRVRHKLVRDVDESRPDLVEDVLARKPRRVLVDPLDSVHELHDKCHCDDVSVIGEA